MPTAPNTVATFNFVAKGTGSSPSQPPAYPYPLPVGPSSHDVIATITFYANPQYIGPKKRDPAVINFVAIGAGFLPLYAPSTLANLNFVASTPIVPFVQRGNSALFQWSKIGRVDFTIDKSNEAGNRPLQWQGLVYAIEQHGSGMILYAAQGVGIVPFSGVVRGWRELLPIGLLGKNAHCDGSGRQIFITSDFVLWEYSDQLKKLDFSKYLNVLGKQTVITYDDSLGIHYICDGTYGFVYSDGSLGVGPVNISGLSAKRSGALIAVAPSDISTPPMQCQTDVYDFGSRKPKSIVAIGFPVTTTIPIQAMIEYRYRTGEAWYSTPWVDADSDGIAWIKVKGVDFRFNWRLPAYEYIEIQGPILVYGPDAEATI